MSERRVKLALTMPSVENVCKVFDERAQSKACFNYAEWRKRM